MNIFRKYFIPHEGNEFKPHLLRNEIAFGLLALILIIEAGFLSQAVLFGRGTGFLALILPNSLIDQTNHNRAIAKLPPLTENALLTAAAQKKANDMAVNQYFAHTSPSGVTPWYWFQQVGYKYTHAGENLAVNFSDSNDVENAWMNSPDHRANILNSSYTQIGIATAQGNYQGQPTVFVVQLFGRPPVAKPAPAPVVPPVVAVAPKPAPAPVVVPTPVVTPTPVVVVQPIPEPAAEPVEVVAPAEVPSNQFNSVAVEGAATENIVQNAAKPVTQPAAKPSADPATQAPAAAESAAPAETESQSNIIQRIFAAPRLTANVIYIILGLMIFFALMLNVFMKISVQHPQLVLNGIMILLALGTLAVFNQHLLLANAQIF
jgi:hypothetical protein